MSWHRFRPSPLHTRLARKPGRGRMHAQSMFVRGSYRPPCRTRASAALATRAGPVVGRSPREGYAASEYIRTSSERQGGVVCQVLPKAFRWQVIRNALTPGPDLWYLGTLEFRFSPSRPSHSRGLDAKTQPAQTRDRSGLGRLLFCQRYSIVEFIDRVAALALEDDSASH